MSFVNYYLTHFLYIKYPNPNVIIHATTIDMIIHITFVLDYGNGIPVQAYGGELKLSHIVLNIYSGA